MITRICVGIETEDKRIIRELAAKEKRSVSNIIRILLNEALQRRKLDNDKSNEIK